MWFLICWSLLWGTGKVTYTFTYSSPGYYSPDFHGLMGFNKSGKCLVPVPVSLHQPCLLVSLVFEFLWDLVGSFFVGFHVCKWVSITAFSKIVVTGLTFNTNNIDNCYLGRCRRFCWRVFHAWSSSLCSLLPLHGVIFGNSVKYGRLKHCFIGYFNHHFCTIYLSFYINVCKTTSQKPKNADRCFLGASMISFLLEKFCFFAFLGMMDVFSPLLKVCVPWFLDFLKFWGLFVSWAFMKFGVLPPQDPLTVNSYLQYWHTPQMCV